MDKKILSSCIFALLTGVTLSFTPNILATTTYIQSSVNSEMEEFSLLQEKLSTSQHYFPENFDTTNFLQDASKAIQSAINQCNDSGGGVVELRKGIYNSGPLTLRSNVYLQIDSGASLVALPMNEYPQSTNPPNFIYALGVHNCGIIGGGVIDGSGAQWWQAYLNTKNSPNPIPRPRLIYFDGCNNIVVSGIILKNSPSFHIVPRRSSDVLIQNITIETDVPSPNTDGIDPATSTNVYINHCSISDGDDNIAIKAQDGPTSNVFITNCNFGLGHGLSIGAQSNAGVSNIYCLNNTFDGTTTGIRIKNAFNTVGTVSNIYYLNSTMKNVGVPLEISAYYPESAIPAPFLSTHPSGDSLIADDICVDSLVATGVTGNALLIVAAPQNPFKDLAFSNVDIMSSSGAIVRNTTMTVHNVNIEANSGSEFIRQENANIIQN